MCSRHDPFLIARSFAVVQWPASNISWVGLPWPLPAFSPSPWPERRERRGRCQPYGQHVLAGARAEGDAVEPCKTYQG
jgi:hypothetical protein